jgi:hypothetical protein
MVDFERQRGDFSPLAARRQALRFTKQRFEQELFGFLDAAVAGVKPERRAA